ncbi:hypothetical protein [Oceanobacillus jordanicus]|uniref:Uncharacterized protein n=1 Tax=Oceanobacillus jordanicus TaxID=2867266 RepID=A0AAW5BB73_9BACI|nr:hypothetical protein [Oceanobacillus jordanicus]MCG3421018.1 hypothetical protein [Oceanobacillus jordanicus]
MQKLQLEKWLLEVDVGRTREYYKQDQELCNCVDCKNYREACTQMDSQIKDVFETLGIDPTKPDLLSEFGEAEDGLHLYMVHYYLAASLVEGKYCLDSDWTSENTAILGNFTFGFAEVDPSEKDDLPMSGLWLEFESKIPWILHDPQ